MARYNRSIGKAMNDLEAVANLTSADTEQEIIAPIHTSYGDEFHLEVVDLVFVFAVILVFVLIVAVVCR